MARLLPLPPRRPPALDLALAGVLAAASAIEPVADHRPGARLLVAGLVWSASLAWRRAAPLLTGLLASVGSVLYAMGATTHTEPLWAFVGTLVIAFSLGTHLDLRRWVPVAVVLLAALVVFARATSADRTLADLYAAPATILLAPALVGTLLRRTRRQGAELRLLSEQLASEREAHARDAAAAERNRIAAELHDVISHAVSLMVVQAGAAVQLLPPGSPVREQVEAIRSTGRTALDELRHQLGALRVGPAAGPQPVPSLAGLPELIAGAGARLFTDGSLEDVPAGVSSAAYRVVQESLTNVRKHAAGGAATIDVVSEPTALVVAVSNGPGRVRDDTPGSGFGLIGMRERVALYAGDLHAGPQPDGGWRVVARFPLDGGDDAESVA